MERVSTKRVLIVGDRPEIGAVVGDLLTRSGYQVLRASYSSLASVVQEGAEEEQPHVAILDTGRVLDTSLSVMESIRSIIRGKLLLVVLTTRGAEEREAEFRRLGANRLLWKPVSAAELLSAVAEAGS